MVGLAALCIAGAAWYSLTRPEAFFPPPGQSTEPEANKTAPAPPKEDEKPNYVWNPTLSPDENRALRIFEEGRAEERAGNRAAAAEHYKEAGKIDHTRKFYWSSLGSLSMLDNDYEQAYVAFKRPMTAIVLISTP